MFFFTNFILSTTLTTRYFLSNCSTQAIIISFTKFLSFNSFPLPENGHTFARILIRKRTENYFPLQLQRPLPVFRIYFPNFCTQVGIFSMLFHCLRSHSLAKARNSSRHYPGLELKTLTTSISPALTTTSFPH